MGITDEKYVAFTTFKRDGTPKSLPVWIVDTGDGTVGFTTSSSSWKVKRLKNDSRVRLQPSNSKGVVTAGSVETAGTAVASAAEFERVAALVKAKYGIQYTMINVMGKVARLIGKGSGTDTAVIITPEVSA